jgi:hypothetical protein
MSQDSKMQNYGYVDITSAQAVPYGAASA